MLGRKATVDASILAGVILDQPSYREWKGELENAELHAPELIRYEVSNAVKQVGPKDAAARMELMRVAKEFPLREVPAEGWWEEAMRLCAVSTMTFYDASYVAVAKTSGTELWTTDRGMAAAAEPEGVKVVMQV